METTSFTRSPVLLLLCGSQEERWRVSVNWKRLKSGQWPCFCCPTRRALGIPPAQPFPGAPVPSTAVPGHNEDPDYGAVSRDTRACVSTYLFPQRLRTQGFALLYEVEKTQGFPHNNHPSHSLNLALLSWEKKRER